MGKNVTILNAILANATQAYKDEVATANQNNFAELGTGIYENPALRNEFINALVNRIAFTFVTSKDYKNPLGVFNKGMVPTGSSVQEIQVDLLEEQAYDPELAESELFKRVKPNVNVMYHVIDREAFYKVTIERAYLKRAFVEPDGLANVVSKIIASMTTSDELHQFLYTKNLFQAYLTEGRFFPVVVTPPTDKATTEDAIIAMKTYSELMTFMSTQYNDAGVYTHTPKNMQALFVKPSFKAQMDVAVLATAFNMSKAEFESRLIVVDDFGTVDTSVLAILVDEEWFQIYDTLLEMTEVDNAQGLYKNYFKHHHQIFSTSRFSNAVVFQTQAPTVVTIDVEPATATTVKGGSVQFTTVATGTNNPVSKATWSVDGTDSSISPTGLLYVGKNETVSPLTVTATSTFDVGVSDTASVTVTGV